MSDKSAVKVYQPCADLYPETVEQLVDDKRCPCCHKANNCMRSNAPHCWCYAIDIPAELLAMLPSGTTGQSCICIECISAFSANRADFIAKHGLT
ncbi:MAG: hypothetical protein ACI8R9_002635 [Paraglaciecola sp.]|jgi:hypothetical protein